MAAGEHQHTLPLFTKEVFEVGKGPLLVSYCTDCGEKVKEVRIIS